MRGFIAALYKDMKLMLNGTGVITLLFSLILLPLFWWGTKDLSAADVVRPFPIAIRDLDETVMSRSLIAQIEEIELFSEVRVAGAAHAAEDSLDKKQSESESAAGEQADENTTNQESSCKESTDDGAANQADASGSKIKKDSTDSEIMATGVAGIVTIPKDFFYAMYRGEDCPVTLTLNENMQLQAAILQSVFTSVMDIISADQSAWRGVYAYVYGDELTFEQQEQLYEDASKDLFTDALSRQRVFESALSGSDMLGVFRRRLAAVLLMMLSILFSLSALKTLPQEWNMGALIRYKAMGASLGGFIFSKLLTCIFWILPMAVLLFFLSGLSVSSLSVGLFSLLTLTILLASFGVNLFFVALTGAGGSSDASSDGVSGLSNMYLLLSLFFGGTLLSMTLLPARLVVLQKMIAGSYVLPVLNAMDTGENTSLIILRMLPMFVIFLVTVVSAVVCTVLGKRKRERRTHLKKAVKSGSVRDGAEKVQKKRQPLFMRLPVEAGMKMTLFTGGAFALIFILGTAFLSGAAAKRSAEFKSTAVTVAVQDEDHSAASRELIKLVQAKSADSIKIIPCQKGDGETLMVDMKVEGLLMIGAGYEKALLENALIPLDYKSTASAFSAQAVREIFAGQVAAQRATFRAFEQAGKMSGKVLTEAEKTKLRTLITKAALVLQPVYRVSYTGGSGTPDPFVPDKMSFLALTLILIMMTAAAYTGRRDALAVTSRLLGMKYGRLMGYGTDLAAVTVLGVLSSFFFVIPAGYLSLPVVAGAALLSLNIAAFSLMITRFSYGAGRVDGLAPLFTLLICLLGGCFLDLSSLSDTARNLMSISPAGSALLFIRGADGAADAVHGTGMSEVFGPVLILLAETVVFIPFGMMKKR